MNQKQAEAEIKYRLIKMILETMKFEGLLAQEDIEAIRKKAVRKLKPLIGSLE